MDFSVKSGHPDKQRTACLIIAVYQPRKLSQAGEKIDEVSEGYLSTIIRRGDMDGELGQTHILHNVAGTLADRVLLVGCGKEKNLNDQTHQKIIQATAKALAKTGVMECHSYLIEAPIKNRDSSWKVRHTVMIFTNSRYKFDQFKSKKVSKRSLRKLVMNVSTRRDLAAGEKAVLDGKAIAAGVSLAKDLANLPANVCTPGYLAKQALQLGKTFKHTLDVEVLEESDMRDLKMGSLLSVSAGSREPAKLITLNYKGGEKDQNPVVLVGKGVTFDSGGISLKAGKAMDEMKYDMGGAAAVIGTINTIAEMQLALNVVGIIPTTENMPDGLATKPGDIVTSMAGLTIEVLNTDAEGRLILCDALTYAEKFDPSTVIDIATLTGACITALGKVPSAVLGNHSPLINEILNAGQQIDDRAWQLPLWDDYQQQLDSNFADIANIGDQGQGAGSIIAACFLSRFTKKYKWAHLDIAGTAWKSGKNKGATGRPVPLLTQYLINQTLKE